MPRIRLRDSCIPPALTGSVLIDELGLPRYWATVWSALHGAALHESTLSAIENPNEKSDPRADAPTSKNPSSVRQMTVTDPIVSVIEMYAVNYRGKPRHSFLFSSQQGKALSKRSVNDVLSILSKRLFKGAAQELYARRKVQSLTPHALRHTCSVVRLTHLIDAGVDGPRASETSGGHALPLCRTTMLMLISKIASQPFGTTRSIFMSTHLDG